MKLYAFSRGLIKLDSIINESKNINDETFKICIYDNVNYKLYIT